MRLGLILQALSAAGALSGAARRSGEVAKRAAVIGAGALIGALVLAVAAGFLIAGAYIWLAGVLPAYKAALIVGAALSVAGAIILLVAFRRPKKEQPEPHGIAERAEASKAALVQVFRDNPTTALTGAVALGVVFGMMRGKD